MSNGRDTWSWSWKDYGACKGKRDLFYAPYQEATTARLLRVLAAQAICAQCPVIDPCDAEATARNEQHGIWAGVPRGTEPGLPNLGRKRKEANAS